MTNGQGCETRPTASCVPGQRAGARAAGRVGQVSERVGRARATTAPVPGHRDPLTRRSLATALVVTSLFVTTGARAGNEEGVLIGNEAAMSGGAVTAVIDDGTAVWFNPAGLAHVRRTQVDASGSATQLRLAETPELLSSATGRADGGYYELSGIPSAVTGARELEPGLVLAFGIFVPSLVGHTDRVRLDDTTGGRTTTYQLVQQENVQQYYAGISLGYAASDTVRVGATVFGLYRQASTVSQFFGGSDGPGGFVSGVSALSSLQSAGVAVSLGLQWEMVPGLELGIALRSPALQLGVLRRSTFTEISAMGGSVSFSPGDDMGLSPRVDLAAAAQLRVGLVYHLDRGWIAIDADVSHELRSPELGLDRRWLVNVRVGGRYEVDPGISVGGGLFTDLSPIDRIQTYGETRIDFLGGSIGFELHTPHRMAEGEQAPTIVFSQTFALRYALGMGTIGGLRFDSTQPEVTAINATRTTVHELALHLGSALDF